MTSTILYEFLPVRISPNRRLVRPPASQGRLPSAGAGNRHRAVIASHRWKGASVATLFGVLTILVLVLVPGYLIWMLIKTIHDERRSQHLRRVWANFSLSIILCILFFVSWGGQAVSQWREFVQDQREHNQPAEAGEFLVDFGASTLENWQSEFLQLFSFVVLAAAFIHRGSSESRDSDDRMEQMLKEIKAKIGA